jgi:hypothetical protein
LVEQGAEQLRCLIRKEAVRDTVGRVIGMDAPEGEAENLLRALTERLCDDEDFVEFGDLTMGELVQMVCRDIGAPFDPAEWEESEDDEIVLKGSPRPEAAPVRGDVWPWDLRRLPDTLGGVGRTAGRRREYSP